jgi:hypothetical protein
LIIVNVIGGLGNQMFQYAAARALAIRKGVPLKLDISAFATYGLHRFELTRVFNCAEDTAGAAEVREMLGWQAAPRIRRLLSRPSLAALRSRKLVLEPGFSYWAGISGVPDDCYLTGYWQSEKYFSDAAAQIREEFTFRQQVNGRNAEVAALISQVNAVSLHVRRGDYASDPRTAATHGLCSLDYYRAALRHIAEHVPNAHLFVFSDDIPWVKQNLPLELPCLYVDHNRGAESFNDMRLMSMCNHHVIANSSFSWWGAWLNPGPDKIVVAPGRWFANDTDVRDLLPADWVKL